MSLPEECTRSAAPVTVGAGASQSWPVNVGDASAGWQGAKLRLLLASDDRPHRTAMAAYLASKGFVVQLADGAGGLEKALRRSRCALVILDVQSLGDDGLLACRRIARDQLLILLDAEATVARRIIGLELGADDYVDRHCSLRELLARTRAVLRRGQHAAPSRRHSTQRFFGCALDTRHRTFHGPSGLSVRLSGAEFALLLSFLEAPGRVLGGQPPAAKAGNHESRALAAQICRLRRKFALCGAGELIRTMRGYGYTLGPPQVAASVPTEGGAALSVTTWTASRGPALDATTSSAP